MAGNTAILLAGGSGSRMRGTVKDKVLERINKINDVLRWTDARKNSLDKSTPEYQKIEADEQKYKEGPLRSSRAAEESR